MQSLFICGTVRAYSGQLKCIFHHWGEFSKYDSTVKGLITTAIYIKLNHGYESDHFTWSSLGLSSVNHSHIPV